MHHIKILRAHPHFNEQIGRPEYEKLRFVKDVLVREATRQGEYESMVRARQALRGDDVLLALMSEVEGRSQNVWKMGRKEWVYDGYTRAEYEALFGVKGDVEWMVIKAELGI